MWGGVVHLQKVLAKEVLPEAKVSQVILTPKRKKNF